MQDKRNQSVTRTGEPSWRARGRGRGGPNQRGSTSGFSRGSSSRPSDQQISSFPGLQNARPNVATPQPSTLEASRRRMNLMASVSRSSGLEKGGDDLKNPSIQEEYRSFIQGKVDKIMQDRSRNAPETEVEKGHRIEAQQNALILFRKLREGVSSTARRDRFALEVYETSLFLSILFESPAQTVSVIPHLFPSNSTEAADRPIFTAGSPSTCAGLCAVLYQLVACYPSQKQYAQQQQTVTSSLPKESPLLKWLQNLTRALRTRNYVRFSRLSSDDIVKDLIEPLDPTGNQLGVEAMLVLIAALRKKVSESAWGVIRGAYRELFTDDSSAASRKWLECTLCLEPSEKQIGDRELSLRTWLESHEAMGHIQRKQDVDGRWLICKVR